MPKCDGEKFLSEEEEDALIEEGCEVVLGRKPLNWKEQVQVLIYWSWHVCPLNQIQILTDLAKRAKFNLLTPNLIRTVCSLVREAELERCWEDEECEAAKEILERLKTPNTLSLN